MDGFGIPVDLSKSAITPKTTKNLTDLKKVFPHTSIFASEEHVGLPALQAGTSEVGHLAMGSGRVTLQPLVKINKEIESGAFFKNKTLNAAIDLAQKQNKKLHLIGITSDGGIHSHITHLFAILTLCKKKKFNNVFLHFVSDGRDTEPKSVKTYLSQTQTFMQKEKIGKIASIVGRYYAFDRDKNWDRNRLAYELWVSAKGKKAADWAQAVDSAYAQGETDEFLKPIVLTENEKPVATIDKGDVVLSFNFRSDRERQLAYVMAEENDLNFVQKLNLHFVTMTEYDENFKNVHVMYKTERPTNILSAVLSDNGAKQAKIAETEKYAHLTFFFNAGKQQPFKNEEWVLVDSEKMASYAAFPEMSAKKIVEKAVQKMDECDFLAINFANCDMVAHSGDKKATEKAVMVVDECVKMVVDELLRRGGQGIVTADHGNADKMEYDDGSPHTSHTTAKVPFILFGAGEKTLRQHGSLADIAPTILKMMDIKIPSEMTGKPLF